VIKGINQFCWPDSVSLLDAMKQAAHLGFESFEICMTDADNSRVINGNADSLGIASYNNPLFNTTSDFKDYKKIKSIADEEGIRISGIGSILTFTSYPITSKDKKIVSKGIDSINKMIEAAEFLCADTVLIIPGVMEPDMDYERGYHRAQDAIAKAAENAEKSGVTLAIENVWNNYLNCPFELAKFVDEINSDYVGVYFDVANARIFGHPEQWIKTLGKRIKKLHVKDFRTSVGNINGFTNLLDGDVDYPAVMKALKSINYGGELIIELIPPPKYCLNEYLKNALNILTKLTFDF
jgi:L-ribulose-5-phosphate 3-epimerase